MIAVRVSIADLAARASERKLSNTVRFSSADAPPGAVNRARRPKLPTPVGAYVRGERVDLPYVARGRAKRRRWWTILARALRRGVSLAAAEIMALEALAVEKRRAGEQVVLGDLPAPSWPPPKCAMRDGRLRHESGLKGGLLRLRAARAAGGLRRVPLRALP